MVKMKRGYIRKKGRDSWQIQVYQGMGENGKYKRYFETVYGSRGNAQRRLDELNLNGFIIPSSKGRDFHREIGEIKQTLVTLKDEISQKDKALKAAREIESRLYKRLDELKEENEKLQPMENTEQIGKIIRRARLR